MGDKFNRDGSKVEDVEQKVEGKSIGEVGWSGKEEGQAVAVKA